MGVDKLSSFLQNDPDVSRRNLTLIEELANKHRSDTKGVEPVLVVDAANFIPVLYNSPEHSLECIYGGQWVQFMSLLKEFVVKLKSKGIKPVFIFDGTLCKEKSSQWIDEGMKGYKEIADIFDEISKNHQAEEIATKHLPPALKMLGRYALKELDVEMYQTDTEMDADNYIADYANRNTPVFAILSDDTDFVIFDTKPMLSVSHLKVDTLESKLYDRKALAERLNISVEQLPLLACLMGNDYVPLKKLNGFHQKLPEGENVATSIAKLIKKNEWTGDVDNKDEISSITKTVFGKNYQGPDLIGSGLKSYVINHGAPPMKMSAEMNGDFKKAAHDRHVTCLNVCIYNVLCKKKYSSSKVFENSNFQSAKIYRQIRQRCYGLLFNCYAARKKETVIKERCWWYTEEKRNDLSKFEAVWPYSLRKDDHQEMHNVMKIEEIWFNTDESKKLEFFRLVLQIPMQFDLLANLPEDQVALSCILNFLIRGKKPDRYLEPLDVAVFVAQALWELSPQEMKKLERPRVEARTVNLSTLFVTGLKAVAMALETCGFAAPHHFVSPWRFFDGKLFHHLHAKAKRTPSVAVLCDGKSEVTGKFYKLLSVATNNTGYDPAIFKWKSILKDFQLEPEKPSKSKP